MRWEAGYEELVQYLRNFVNIGHDPFPYDTNGILHLMVALLDNLRENALDEDLMQLAPDVLTDEQAMFLRTLAEWQTLPVESD